MSWVVELVPPAVEELEILPPGLRGRMIRLMALVEEYGLSSLSAPNGRQIDGKLLAMRVIALEGIARGMYVTRQGRRLCS